jgi:Dolichyl-phosphate-mannose-protein mannosyltransferase
LISWRSGDPWSVRRWDWLALGAIGSLFGAASLWVGPRANVPVIDDWVYAWSVEHFLQTGRLRVLEFSAVYPIAQIVWGAMFARVAGFSFGVLRCSTLVLSTLGCWAVYLTLREMGCRRSTSLLAACALALDPVYFALSFSFMTDVPFVSVAAIATYFYVSAVCRDRTARLWVGGLFSIVAFLVRPLAIILPFAVAPVLLCRIDRRSAVRRAALPLVTTAVAMVALRSAISGALGPLDWETNREGQLRWWFLIPMTAYMKWNIAVLIESAFPLAPVLLASMVRWRRAMLVAAVGLLLVVPLRLGLGALPTPLPDWQTWSLQDIAARAMIGGDLASSAWSLRVTPALRVLGLLAVVALAIVCLRGGTRAPRWGRAEIVVGTLALLHLALINLLWLYNDRYYLVLAPALAILSARALDDDRLAKSIAAGCLVLWAAVAASGTRDMLAFGEACAAAAREVEAAGVPAWEIDAGYPLNGWHLYAHSENLPPGSDRRYDVPFVTSDRPTEYAIMNRPLPGFDVVRVVPLERASWQTTRAVYVLRRR